MQLQEHLGSLSFTDRTRLMRWLEDGRLYAGLAARSIDADDLEWVVACLDRALDAIAAARILLPAPAEPQPWADESYRAFRTHRPASALRVPPAELAALRDSLRRRPARGAAAPSSAAGYGR